MLDNSWSINRDGIGRLTSSSTWVLTPQQEILKQDVYDLISSLPAYKQKAITALGLQMSQQLLLRTVSETVVRQILVGSIEDVAKITRPTTSEMLLNHTRLVLFHGLLTQIEQQASKTKISEIQEIIKALRDETVMLQDELMDWPNDGSVREISYREAIQQSDGSWKLTKVTKSMTKEEAKALIDALENQINEMSKILESDMLEIQNSLGKQSQKYQTVSSTLMSMHDVGKITIKNMRP